MPMSRTVRMWIDLEDQTAPNKYDPFIFCSKIFLTAMVQLSGESVNKIFCTVGLLSRIG